MLRLVICLCVILPSLLSAAKAAVETPADNRTNSYRIIAEVNGKKITFSDVNHAIKDNITRIYDDFSVKQDEFEHTYEASYDHVIQALADRILIVEAFHADKKNKVSDIISRNSLNKVISSLIKDQFDNNQADFEAYLKSNDKTPESFRTEIEEDYICDYMRRKHRDMENIIITPAQIKEYHDAHWLRFYQDSRVLIDLIQIKRGNRTDDELREKTDFILKRLNEGDSFANLARQFSEYTRREDKVGWGWKRRGDFKPEIANAIFKLKKGEVSEPVIFDEDVLLFYIEDRQYAHMPILLEVRGKIMSILITQIAEQNEIRWLETLRDKATIIRYDKQQSD